MGNEQNWRQEVTMFDVLAHDRKQNQVADRRPVIRKPSDLVGPGIAQQAVRITDWNNVLATFNGYFSSVSAINAPQSSGGGAGTDTHKYSGYVISDGEYGGKQVITDLDTYVDYTRIFRRAPTDPNTIAWGTWFSSSDAPATAFSEGNTATAVPTSALTPLNAPTLNGSNWAGTYAKNGTHLDILRDGVYVGVIRVYSFTGATGLQGVSISVTLPRGLATETLSLPVANISAPEAGARIPFTSTNLQDTSFIAVSVQHSVGGAPTNIYWGIDITRTGGVL